MSASKIWNESNHTKISSDRKIYLTLLLPIMFDGINKTVNESDEVWRLLHRKYGMSRIVRKYIRPKKTDLTLLLLMMFDLMDETMNDSDEMWRWVHYKYGMIRNVKQLNSTGWGTALTLLLPMMLNWIHETINESDAAWRLVHLKYGMSRLIQKFHWIIKKCSYIAVTDNVI